MIHKDTTVKCNVSNKVHKLTKLPNSISCELSDIVYLITCKKCNKYYVGETGRAFRSRMYEHILSEKKQGKQNHPSVQTLYRQGAFCQRSEILNIGMVYSKIQHTQS